MSHEDTSIRSDRARFDPRVWLAGSALALCLAAEVAILGVGIDDLDEGYFAQQAARVLHGQVPYRDFATLYSPGLLYLHAWLFQTLGDVSLVALRAVSVLFRAGTVVLLFAMAKPLVRQPLWAAAPGLLLLIGLDDAPTRWEPHPGWPSAFFAILATFYVTRGTAARWLLAAGAAAGLSYAFKQNTGVFILGAILAYQLWRRRPCAEVALPALSFAVLTAVWAIPLMGAMRGELGRLGVLVGAVNQAGLFSPPEPGLLIPLGCLAGGLWLVRDEPRSAWLTLAGAALLLTQLPRMDNAHLMWSASLLLVLGVATLDRARPLIVAGALVATLILVLPTLMDRLQFLALPRAAIAGVSGPVQTVADLQAVTDALKQRTAPGEPIFVYPSSPLLYVLADRPNPTRYDHLNPGALTAADINTLIAELDAAHVRVVVVSEYWQAIWGPPGDNAVLEQWLAAHFVADARFGAYRLLTRPEYNASLARMFAWSQDAGARH